MPILNYFKKIFKLLDNLTGNKIWLCIAPVVIGTAMAYGDGIQNFWIAFILLCIAIIIYYVFVWILRIEDKQYLTDNTLIDDVITFVLLGPFAVAGTYYAQSHEMNLAVLLSGVSPGLLSIAVLTVFHLIQVKREELQEYYNKHFIFTKYLFCIITALIFSIFIFCYTYDHLPILSTSVILFYSIKPIINVLTKSDKKSLESAQTLTIRIFLLYMACFSIGWIM